MRGDVLIRICTFCYSKTNNTFDPFALRKAKIVYNFGLSECKRVKDVLLFLPYCMKKKTLPFCAEIKCEELLQQKCITFVQ